MCQKAVLQGSPTADLLTLFPRLPVGKPDLALSSMNLKDNQTTARSLPTTLGTVPQQGIDSLDPEKSISSQVERRGRSAGYPRIHNAALFIRYSREAFATSAVTSARPNLHTDINFERDFGQWFNDPDEVTATPSNTAPSLWAASLPTLSQQSSVEDMFSSGFMQSVANQLEDFDSNLFRPDGDIDFERDFGQWFNNPDDVDALDMRP
ncbi:hypothetical protein VNI00_010660 [Paramarasmius palmivorus]|uniref:Uncharacterized protein n=1 Tax=Paramarasmius palmivorus TaxID=297713 RepID=A0AAW0CG48_9AGAR